MDRPSARDACGMNHPVEPIGNRGEHGGDRGLVGDVGRHELESCSEVLGHGGQVGADHRAALGQQPPGGGEADAGCSSGYDERSRMCTAR
jgi:hypothetical protein